MKNFRFIPRLEIKSLNVIKGMRMEGLRVVGNPSDLAESYYLNGADEIIYDDIVASLYNREIDYSVLKSLSEKIQIPVTVSGNLNSLERIYKVLNSGADKVSINTSAVLKHELLYQATREFGSQCIVSYIQGKNLYEDYWEVFTESGRNRNNMELFEWIQIVQDLGVGEVIFISIDHDGMNNGVNKNLISKLRKSINVPFIFGGGIKRVEDIDYLINLKVDGVSLSSILHLEKRKLMDLKKKTSNNYAYIRTF